MAASSVAREAALKDIPAQARVDRLLVELGLTGFLCG